MDKKMNLFTYAILFHPTEKEVEEGKKSELIVPPETILAQSEETAGMLIIKQIPDKYNDKLEQVEVLIRPF